MCNRMKPYSTMHSMPRCCEGFGGFGNHPYNPSIIHSVRNTRYKPKTSTCSETPRSQLRTWARASEDEHSSQATASHRKLQTVNQDPDT